MHLRVQLFPQTAPTESLAVIFTLFSLRYAAATAAGAVHSAVILKE